MNLFFDVNDAVTTKNLSEAETGLVAVNDDPQIHFKWPGRFRPGWYAIHLEFERALVGKPCIYLDMGHGFSEVERIPLTDVSDGLSFVGLAKLPYEPNIVRLDPSDRMTNIDIRSFSVSHRSTAEMTIRGVGRLMSRSLRNPEMFLPMVRRGMQLAFGRSVAGVRGKETPDLVEDPYQVWMSRFDYSDKRDRPYYEEAISKLEHKPLISVLMPTYNTDPDLLSETIDSVIGQIYPNWELCIADDCSTRSGTVQTIKEYAERDERIRYVLRQENGHIPEANNSAFSLVSGEWVAMLDHDDLLRPHSLAEIAMAINANRDAQVVYSDEDKITGKGERFDPHFKPDHSPVLFRSMNYWNHLTVHRADNIRAVGGWRKGYEGSQDYDLNLRIIENTGEQNVVHIPQVLYHWRALEGSTALAQAEKGYAWEAGFRALQEHVERTGVKAEICEIEGLPYYRMKHEVDTSLKVTLIIPTRDRVDLLRVAVDSILEKTDYPNFKILIVDNGSEEVETRTYLEETVAENDLVRVIDYPHPFNFSAINNFAVEHTDADIVGLINNDVEVITPGWLTEMVSWAQQPDVGCVGAKLYYPDDTIQHAGVIAGIGGVAGHSHKYLPRDRLGYFARARLAQNLSAVTAACMLVRRSVYLEVGGLEEKALSVAFNDVDFCFRVAEAGYFNVWTPWAELYHHESKTRGLEDNPEKVARFQSEVRYMQDNWSERIRRDPFYNPNLSDRLEDFSIRD